MCSSDLEALRTGRADLALVGLPGEAPDGLDAHVLVDEELVLACSPDHELASRSTCSLDGLRDQVLISLPRGTGLRTALDTACAARGFQPHIAFEASRPATLAHLAARGLGLAVLPAPAARYYASELHAIAMRPRLRSRIVLAWRSEGTISPAARTLVAHARRTLGG